MLLKKLPYPAAGLMLGLAALGNLLATHSANLRYTLGAISFAILVLLVLKTIINVTDLKAAFEQPAVASVLPTFSMGMAILAGYIRSNVPQVSLYLWYSALLLHLAILIAFTLKHVVSFNIKKVFPSWFIVYVGLAVFSVTAPAFSQRPLGQAIFWFALVAYVALLPLTLYRVLVVKEVPPPATPLIVIFTAPSSLALAGYLNSFVDKNINIVWFLAACTLLSFFAVMACMPRLLKLPFFPSYAAFTFPFVITGIALKGTNGFLNQSGRGFALLSSSIQLFELWAAVMVLYVLYRYITFVFGSPTPVQPSQAPKLTQ